MSNLKRFLALTLALLMIVGGATIASAKQFTDVAASDKYASAVDVLSNLKVILGTSPTEFSPSTNVTREQFALLMARYISGVPDAFAQASPNEAAPFPDCKDPTYFAAIQYCKDKGIINGKSEKVFDPKGNITFEEAMKMMIVALGYTDIKGGTGATWSLPYIQKANDLTINSGKTEYNPNRVKINMFNGFENKVYTASMSRGECALLMYNAFRADMAETYTEYKQAILNGSNVLVPTVINKTIAINIFNCEEVTGRVTSNKDYAMADYTKAQPKKDSPNPITVNGKQFDLLKSDVDTFKLIGKEVSYLVKNEVIVSDLATLGTEVAIESISYNNADGVRKLTVNGELYDLGAWDQDRIVYTWNDWAAATDANYGKLVRLTADKANEFLPLVNHGFYQASFIDNVNYSDAIIFYPMTTGKAGGERTTASYIIGGVNFIKDKGYPQINLNGVEAAENDYVLYYNNSAAKIFYVTAKAAKVEGVAAGTIYNDHWKAVFGSSTYEVLDNTTMNTRAISSKFEPLQKYNIYTVGDKVVFTEKYDSGAYDQKNYFVVQRLAVAGKNDAYVDVYGFYLLNMAGASQGRLNVTQYNSLVPPTAAPGVANPFNLYGGWFRTGAADDVGTIVVKDPDDGAKLIKNNTEYSVAADGTVTDGKFLGKTDKFFSAGVTTINTAASNLYNLPNIGGAGNNYFTTADYSKVLVKYADKYVAYSGKGAIPDLKNVAITKVEAVVTTRDSATIPTLSFMYIESTSASTVAIIPATGDLYLVVIRESYSASNEVYKVLNPVTGEVISGVVYATTEAKYDAPKFTHNDIVTVESNKITGKPTYALGAIAYANGYYTFGSTVAANNGAKIWVWNATDVKYDQQNQDYIGGGKTGYLVSEANKAIWGVAMPTTYTVTFAIDAATLGVSPDTAIVAPATITVVAGSKITLPGATKTNKASGIVIGADTWRMYAWTNTATLAVSLVGAEITVNSNMTFTTLWTNVAAPVLYSVVFSANGGTGTVPATKQGAAGSAITLPAADTLTAPAGKNFVGWSTSPDGTTGFMTAGATYLIPANNVLLYAIWA